MAITDPNALDRMQQQARGNPSAILRALLAPQQSQAEMEAMQNQARAARNDQRRAMGIQHLQMESQLAMRKYETTQGRLERERQHERQLELSELSLTQQMELMDYKWEMENRKRGGKGRRKEEPQPIAGGAIDEAGVTRFIDSGYTPAELRKHGKDYGDAAASVAADILERRASRQERGLTSTMPALRHPSLGRAPEQNLQALHPTRRPTPTAETVRWGNR